MGVRYATVCSGIDAPVLAWTPLGWTQVFSSEVDRFPCQVLEHHNPDVPNLGDMTKINGEEYAGTIDVLCGGTPCQDFSVAGKHEGMDGDRGGLTLKFVELVGQIRPGWVVWENVPGVLSSNNGKDFARFLHEMAEVGYFGAWRVLDAQYFGLAQRRKRVFAVFCPGNWQRAAAVLLEPESMSRNPAPSREAGKGFAPTISARTRGGGGLGTDFDLDGGLIPIHCPDISPALKARDCKGPSSDGDGDGAPILAFDTTQLTNKDNRSNPQPGDPCHSLSTGAHAPAIAFAYNDHAEHVSAISPTVRSLGKPPAVAFDLRGREGGALPEGPHPTANIRAASGGSSRSYVIHGTQDPICSDIGHALGRNSGQENVLVKPSMVVRRLTPRECERLQGFPDDYTRIPRNGKPASTCADGPRYKALGNSMAVPVMRWLGNRIQSQMELKCLSG